MYELIIYCRDINLDSFSDSLFSLGALSISIEDADSGNINEKPMFDEPFFISNNSTYWDYVILTVLIDDEINHDDFILNAIKITNINKNLIIKYFKRPLDDSIDWVSEFHSKFKPINILDKLFIVPSWYKNDFSSNNKLSHIIEIDPGLAFGTGTHPTTYLCLSWLVSNIVLENSKVLDYGCGSGILSIAASKLGYKYVTAIDIDHQSLEITAYNSMKNKANINILYPEQIINDSYNIIIANILANPLKDLANKICSCLSNNGQLILSGILSSQANEICQFYAKWIHLSIWKELDGWVCLHGKNI